ATNSSLYTQLGTNEKLNTKEIEKSVKIITSTTSQTLQNKVGNDASSNIQTPEISSLVSESNPSGSVINKINANKISIDASGLIEQPGQKIYISVSKDNKLIAGQDSKPIKSLSSKIGNGDWIEISLNNAEQPNSPTRPILTDKYQNGEFLNTLKSKPEIETSSISKINDIKSSDSISKITQNYSTKPDLTLSKGDILPKESVPASADLINDASSSIGSKIQPVVVTPNNSVQNSNETSHSPLISATQNSNGSKINLNENLKFSNQNEEQNQKQTLNKKQINYDQNISGQSFTHDITVALKNDAPVQLPSLSAEVMKTVKANELMNEINRFVQQGNSKSALLKLDPENLGKVKIVLDVVDKSVHASVEVENENVRQIVQNNINELKQSLNLSGLQLSSVNVSLNNNDENTNKSLTQKKKSGYNQYERKIEEPAGAVSSKSMGYNTYDYLI
ncbi:MAG TPA: flagellar hook-length control protein FliK, partial [Ignavibacteriaceae bacterium]|nr:flagellar hook-length control protein FliK [Ignavibacteriaceae bacterium]